MLYLTRSLGFDHASADTQLGLWNGVCYLCPLLGGYVADATLGRWRAIVAFTALYAAGTAFLTAGVLVPAGAGARLAFFAPVYVVAVGSGLPEAARPRRSAPTSSSRRRPGRAAPRADRPDAAPSEPPGAGEPGATEPGAPDDPELEQFYNYLYWGDRTSARSSRSPPSSALAQNVSIALAFAVATLALAGALGAIVAGDRAAARGGRADGYVKRPPEGSALSAVAVLVAAARRPRAPARARRRRALRRARARAGTSPSRPAATARRRATGRPRGARRGGPCADDEVAMTRQVCALLPIFASLVVYWGVQGQMATTFFNQGCQMDLRLGGATVPVACLNLFNNVIIIAPCRLRRLRVPALPPRGLRARPLAKIGAGTALEALVMVAAAAAEARRRARAPAARLSARPRAR